MVAPQAQGGSERGFPLAILVFVIALGSLIALLDLDYDILQYIDIPNPNGATRSALVAVIILSVTWLLLQAFGLIFERLAVARGETDARVRSVWKLITYVVWAIVLGALVIGLLGDVTGTALGLGLLGAGLAFALQRPLLNIAAWFVITSRRIYSIGHRIELGGVKGYVTDIHMMHTEVQEFGEWMHGDTFTGRIVAIPNAIIFDVPAKNYTRDFPFVWDEVSTLVTYESDIDVAEDHMVQAAKEVVGKVMTESHSRYSRRLFIRELRGMLPMEPSIRMDFADSGVNLYVVYFCSADERRRVRSEIVKRIWKRFSEDDRVAIAYPHLQLVQGAERGPPSAVTDKGSRRKA